MPPSLGRRPSPSKRGRWATGRVLQPSGFRPGSSTFGCIHGKRPSTNISGARGSRSWSRARNGESTTENMLRHPVRKSDAKDRGTNDMNMHPVPSHITKALADDRALTRVLFERPESLSVILPYDEVVEEGDVWVLKDGSLGAVFIGT